MKPCTCTHVKHGERLAQSGKVRIIPNACLHPGCGCEVYVPAEVKSDILDDEIKRAFMDVRRAFINLERKMKERGLELK